MAADATITPVRIRIDNKVFFINIMYFKIYNIFVTSDKSTFTKRNNQFFSIKEVFF